jgi:hypothetical protein
VEVGTTRKHIYYSIITKHPLDVVLSFSLFDMSIITFHPRLDLI